jgi:hypothetical protein
MILSPELVESFERCRRQWAFQNEFELIRTTPMGALYHALDYALTMQSGPESPSDYAKLKVMNEAGERGVWTQAANPYQQIKNYAAMAELLARVLRQPSAEPLKRHPIVNVGDHKWQPQSYLTDNGLRIMRIVLCDHWDDDRQLAELHSWRTVGDVSTTGLPMTLRVLVIGQSREGRRHSFWTKGQRHPVNKQLRFARKHGKADGLSASWETVWREEAGISAQAWLEQMARDGVLKELAFDRQVKVPSKDQRDRVLGDICRIADEMITARSNQITLPMTRSACDDPIRGSCAFSCVCYSGTELSPDDTGVFRRKTRRP